MKQYFHIPLQLAIFVVTLIQITSSFPLSNHHKAIVKESIRIKFLEMIGTDLKMAASFNEMKWEGMQLKTN